MESTSELLLHEGPAHSPGDPFYFQGDAIQSPLSAYATSSSPSHGICASCDMDRLTRVALAQVNLFCCPDGFRERPAVGEDGETGAVERHHLI
jgi:hypothetical protein